MEADSFQVHAALRIFLYLLCPSNMELGVSGAGSALVAARHTMLLI